MRRILFFGTVAVLGLAVIGCVNREQQKQAKKTEEILADTTKPVVLVSVGTADLKDVLSITGAITTSEIQYTVAGLDPPGNDVKIGAPQRVRHSLMFRR